jgi:hypothetical protein
LIYIIAVVAKFQAERDKIAAELAEARRRQAALTAELDELTVELTHVRARIASLEAEDRVYSGPASGPAVAAPATGDLSHMTIRQAILTVLDEAKPAPIRLRDLEQMMAVRGKRVAGGLSVDLNTLKGNKEVLNPSWGYWTVP